MLRLFYDLETTGFIDSKLPLSHPKQPRIVQIGAVLDDENGKERGRLNIIIAQRDPIPPKAFAAHKISMEDSQRFGVREDVGVELLLDMIEVADVIVGHNHKDYDNKIVQGAARRIVQNEDFDPFAGKSMFDTMVAGKAVARLPHPNGGLKNPKLTELYKHFFGEVFEDAHQAISDVLACRASFYEMQKLLNPQPEEPETV